MINREDNRPMVSVVMSCYNHGKYVAEAIESVLAQTYTDFEFLIADDGSTDGSPEIIKKYDDPRISFYECEKNTAFGAWEYLDGIAKGKYITYIASDDVWRADKLQMQVDFLEEHEEYGVCFSWVDIINGESELVNPDHMLYQRFNVSQRDSAEWYKKLFMEGNSLSAPSFMMRNEIFQELNGFLFEYRQLQDYELWLRYLLKHKLYLMPEKLVLYRWHDTEDTANISAPSDGTFIRSWNETFHIYQTQIEMISDELFVKAFEKNLLRKNLNTHEEVMCEKFFLLLNHPRIEAQQCGINYYLTHIGESAFRDCMENVYGFSRGDFYIMEVNRGVMKEMRDMEKAAQESKNLASKALAYLNEANRNT